MTTVSSYVQSEKGKWYLEVDGQPFLFYTVQAWREPSQDLETIFAKTKEAGFETLSLWIHWRAIEPIRKEYDFSYLAAILQLAVRFDLRIQLCWAGTNFCDKLDPRFTPGWIFSNFEFLRRSEKGDPIVIGGGDMGDCFVANLESPQLLEAETAVLRQITGYLEKQDTSHRVIAIQLENDINMNQYISGKKETLSYINALCAAMEQLPYRIATSVTIRMWHQDTLDPEIYALPAVYAQGISTLSPRVSRTRQVLSDLTSSKFKYISCNCAYENSAAHILTAFSCGGFYSIYKLDNDILWDNPGVYSIRFEETPITLPLRILNRAIHKISCVLAQAAPEDMIGFNLEQDGMPDMFYSGTKELGGHSLGFITCGNTAVGLCVLYRSEYFFIASGNASLMLDIMPEQCESGFFDGDMQWHAGASLNLQEYDRRLYAEYTSGDCIRIRFSDIWGHL